MAMHIGPPEEDAELNTTINTTPLVDVMLVLLIIFLITVPVIVKMVPVNLPNDQNIPTQTKPTDIVIAVTPDESVYVDNVLATNNDEVIQKLETALLHAQQTGAPPPEVHIRGDQDVRFEAVGRVVYDCQRAGILKVAFLLEPQNKED